MDGSLDEDFHDSRPPNSGHPQTLSPPLSDMLDLKVMELLQEKKIPEMVDTILQEHSRSGLVPGEDSLSMAVSVLAETEDVYSLEALEKAGVNTLL